MENHQLKLKKVRQYAKMESEEDIKLFDITIYELAATNELKVFDQLMDLFDDDCEFPDVMFNLVHALETFSNQDYVRGVLLKSKDFRKYPEWYTTLIYRILNSKNCSEIFKRNMYLAAQQDLLEIFDLIYQESEMHRPIIDELREILKSQ
jgi:hypothetical protein